MLRRLAALSILLLGALAPLEAADEPEYCVRTEPTYVGGVMVLPEGRYCVPGP